MIGVQSLLIETATALGLRADVDGTDSNVIRCLDPYFVENRAKNFLVSSTEPIWYARKLAILAASCRLISSVANFFWSTPKCEVSLMSYVQIVRTRRLRLV